MVEQRRKPGRPRKSVGLTPPSLLRVADGLDVREVRASDPGSEEPILSGPRGEDASEDATRRVFGPAVVPSQAAPPLPHAAARRDNVDLSLQVILKRLLAETAGKAYQDRELGYEMTNAEALARRLLDRALMGNEKAQEMVIDRVEGKAGRSVDAKAPDTTLEELIDRSEIDALNALVPTQEPPDDPLR